MAIKYEIICISSGTFKNLLTEDELAYKCNIHPGLIARLRLLGVIETENDEKPFLYSSYTVLKIKRILRLRHDLGINYAAAGIINDLIEKIDKLEEKVRKYEKGR